MEWIAELLEAMRVVLMLASFVLFCGLAPQFLNTDAPYVERVYVGVCMLVLLVCGMGL